MTEFFREIFVLLACYFILYQGIRTMIYKPKNDDANIIQRFFGGFIFITLAILFLSLTVYAFKVWPSFVYVVGTIVGIPYLTYATWNEIFFAKGQTLTEIELKVRIDKPFQEGREPVGLNFDEFDAILKQFAMYVRQFESIHFKPKLIWVPRTLIQLITFRFVRMLYCYVTNFWRLRLTLSYNRFGNDNVFFLELLFIGNEESKQIKQYRDMIKQPTEYLIKMLQQSIKDFCTAQEYDLTFLQNEKSF